MSVDPYRLVRSVRAHFTRPDYDYFTAKTRARAPREDDPDRRRYERLALHRDPLGLVVATLVEEPRAWVGDIIGTAGQARYLQRRRVLESMTHVLCHELAQMGNLDVWAGADGRHPPLVEAYLGGRVSLEVATLVSDVGGVRRYWRERYPGDPIIEQVVLRLAKYSPFIDYDRARARKIIVDSLREVA